jgi:hypothetical protein
MVDVIHEPAQDVLVSTSIDVLVVGAGSAGVAAAVSAAECGVCVVLVDASGMVGGTLAAQLLEHSAGFHDAAGNPVIGGFGQRLVDRLTAYGASPGHVRDDTGYTATRTPINHAELSLCEAVLLNEAGVPVLLNSPVVRVVRSQREVQAAILEGKSGRHAVRARFMVDCSGDADLAARAGAAFQSDEESLQPASLLFKLGGIDFEHLIAYMRDNPSDFRPGSTIPDAAGTHMSLWGFGQLLRRGHVAGALSLRRYELHFAGWPSRHEAVINVTRVKSDPLNPAWSGAAAGALSLQVLEFARFFRKFVPGCQDAYIVAVASRIGVRESRRIAGEYTLTREDLLRGARFPDAIAQCGFPIDIHDETGPSLSHAEQLRSAFDIPYRCLIPRGLDNLLVAGRCISCTHEALGSVRLTAPCFATGEAAGVGAALCVTSGCAASQIDVMALRSKLLDRGALLASLQSGGLILS